LGQTLNASHRLSFAPEHILFHSVAAFCCGQAFIAYTLANIYIQWGIYHFETEEEKRLIKST